MKGMAWFIAVLTGFALSQLFGMYRKDFSLFMFMAVLLLVSSARIYDWLLTDEKPEV